MAHFIEVISKAFKRVLSIMIFINHKLIHNYEKR